MNELVFNNVSDFTRYLEAHKDSENQTTIYCGSKWRPDTWTGVGTWYEFMDYLEDGNPDATADIRKNAKYYIDKFEDKFTESSEYMFDVVGEFFDIGAVMVGEPEAWIKEVKIEDDKFINLTIQGSYPHNTDLDMVRENGSKVLAIALTLEKMGFLVQIDVAFHTRGSYLKNSNKETRALIKVKGYDQGLDYKKLGIVLGVPFFRRGFLRLLEIEYGKDVKVSYGTAGMKTGDINLARTGDILELEKKLEGE